MRVLALAAMPTEALSRPVRLSVESDAWHPHAEVLLCAAQRLERCRAVSG